MDAPITKTETALAAIFRHCDEVAEGKRPARSEKEGMEAAKAFLGLLPAVTPYSLGPPVGQQRMAKPVLGIVPQTQPNDVTCVQTCLAMALGVPVSQVIARYGDKALNQIALWHAIQECGIVANAFVYPPPVCRGWHFLAAPSLNMSGSEHQLLMHYEPDDGSQGITILDPAGEGKHCYQRDGSNLKSWHSLIWFNPGGSLDWLNAECTNPEGCQ